MEKTKRKAKVEQTNWWARLTGPAPLDFVSELSLESCLRRLEAKAQRSFWRPPSVHVDIQMIDEDTYTFYVKRTGSKYPTNQARGVLKRWDNNYTSVTGEVWIPSGQFWGIWAIFPMLAFFLILGSATDVRGFAGFAVLMMTILPLAAAFSFLNTVGKRDELKHIVEDALGYVGT
jgi:hypothetical protein